MSRWELADPDFSEIGLQLARPWIQRGSNGVGQQVRRNAAAVTRKEDVTMEACRPRFQRNRATVGETLDPTRQQRCRTQLAQVCVSAFASIFGILSGWFVGIELSPILG